MTTKAEMLNAWLNGTATGGPYNDGRYPLIYADGETYLVYSPAAQALNPAFSETEVEVFANSASTSANIAASAAVAADESEAAAAGHATAAAGHATTAGSHKDAAAASASTASTKAMEAAASATTATTKATDAAASATDAAGSATTATTKAGEAAASAADAAGSATTATTRATEAATSATSAATARTGAETAQVAAESAQGGADSAKTAALSSQNAAAASATTASTKASEASTSATNASNSATSASTSAATATTKAGEASTSATNAAGSANLAAAWANTNENTEVASGAYSAKHWAAKAAASAQIGDASSKVSKAGDTMTGALRYSRNLGASDTSFTDIVMLNQGAYDGQVRRIALHRYDDVPQVSVNFVGNSLSNFASRIDLVLNNTLTNARRFGFLQDGVLFMANVEQGAPATPVAGGHLYVEGGNLKFKAPNGQVTTLASSGTGLAITWNPSDKHADITLSAGNLDATNNVGGTWRSVRGNALHASLKSYFEIQIITGASIFGGIADNTHDLTTHLGNVTGGTGGHAYAVLDTNKWHGGANSAIFSPGLGVGDTLMVAFDPVSRKLWFGRNGTWVGSPSAGTGEAYIVNAGYTYYPGASAITAGHTARLKTLASAFTYAIPAGFVAAAG